ncbi:MAG: Crp/Fnr family transcriptional regulator [Gammaproteobacteria bacterium]|nr:Crp/Fnr family transcriptional regulator [Gammaproteobacteria bacterium]MCP5137000.1 Crp/Fnr family transcriptional regulator [Gammaproteobacteria bacterium]
MFHPRTQIPPAADRPDWVALFPELRAIESACRGTLLDAGRILDLSAHQPVFHVGQHADNYLLVLNGQVRVYRIASNGREIDLYRVNDGQSCVLTTSCLFAGDQYPADGITTQPVRAVAIPRNVFHEAIGCSTVFRQFVFASFSQRMSVLLTLIDDLVFGRIDARLAQCLLRLAETEGGEIVRTHQALANELGSAREVISRQLKEFENQRLVKLGRARLTILDHQALRRIVREAAK